MPAIIENEVLISTLEKHLKGKVKESVNFTFTPDVIKIQSSGDFLFDSYITGEYTNDMVGKSFSIIVNNSIKLLKSSKGSTTITNHGDEIVVLDQGDVSIPFNVAYDERLEVKYESLQRQGKVASSDFSFITRGFRNLINLSKTLEVGIPAVVITSGKVYCIYSNTIFIGDVPMEFPDLEIPYNTFNNLSKNIDSHSVILSDDIIKKILLIQMGSNSSASTIYKTPNMSLIISINAKLGELEYIGRYTTSAFETLEMLFKCFPRETVVVSMYEDSTIGVTFSLANGKNIKAGAKSVMTRGNISISTTQFDAIYKTFKETSSLEVYKGRDIICLKSTNKTLILSGMTF